MFTFKRGDILVDPSEVLVNPVNCVGVMGAGLAKIIKEHYPENYEAYRVACQQREIVIGKVHVFDRGHIFAVRYIFNAPTKLHWKDPSRLEYISAVLKDIRAKILEYEIKTIAIPKLGCGHGGLQWSMVRNMILHQLDGLDDTDVRIYGE